MYAAMGILSGYQDLVALAGGVESMSRFQRSASATTLDAGNAHLRSLYPTVPQGISADLIATIEGFTRADVDSFAATSQERAAIAIKEGRFAQSMVPVHNLDGTVALDHEEHPRPGTTVESLSALPAVFGNLAAPSSRPSMHPSTTYARGYTPP